MRSAHFAVFVVLLASLALTGNVFGQVPAIGTPAFNSFGGGPFDVINLGNLNVHFVIPIVHKAGRQMPFHYDLSYNSSIWSTASVSGSTTWVPATNYGWMSQTNGTMGYVPKPSQFGNCGTHSPYESYSYTGYVDSQGTFHHVPGLQGARTCDDGTETGSIKVADDGSGYKVSVTANENPAYVTTRDGQTFPVMVGDGFVTSTAQDANGNLITTADGKSFTDTLGTNVLKITTATTTTTYAILTPSGSANITAKLTQKTVCSNFLVPGIIEEGVPRVVRG